VTRHWVIWPLPDRREEERPPQPGGGWGSFSTRGRGLDGQFDPSGTEPLPVISSDEKTGADA